MIIGDSDLCSYYSTTRILTPPDREDEKNSCTRYSAGGGYYNPYFWMIWQ